MAEMTKGKFGFHRGGGKHEPVPAAAYVQIYVKSSALSRAPDLAISAHLMTEAEIDEFVDDAKQAIAVRELDATTHLPPQHRQLMPEGGILCFKSALRLERQGEQGQEEA